MPEFTTHFPDSLMIKNLTPKS